MKAVTDQWKVNDAVIVSLIQVLQNEKPSFLAYAEKPRLPNCEKSRRQSRSETSLHVLVDQPHVFSPTTPTHTYKQDAMRVENTSDAFTF